MRFGWLEQWEGVSHVSRSVPVMSVVARNPLLFCTERSAQSTTCAPTGGPRPALPPSAAHAAFNPLPLSAAGRMASPWWPTPRSARAC